MLFLKGCNQHSQILSPLFPQWLHRINSEKHVKTASHMDPKQDRQDVSSKAKYRRAEV